MASYPEDSEGAPGRDTRHEKKARAIPHIAQRQQPLSNLPESSHAVVSYDVGGTPEESGAQLDDVLSRRPRGWLFFQQTPLNQRADA